MKINRIAFIAGNLFLASTILFNVIEDILISLFGDGGWNLVIVLGIVLLFYILLYKWRVRSLGLISADIPEANTGKYWRNVRRLFIEK